MTANLNLPESYDQFTNMIERVRHGEEIIIYSAGIPVAKIVILFLMQFGSLDS
jgi:antitoxin (DNA-binding transcriptional repressor) of toxin-antitoxin stability system